MRENNLSNLHFTDKRIIKEKEIKASLIRSNWTVKIKINRNGISKTFCKSDFLF